MYSFSSLSARGGRLYALWPLRLSIGTFAPFIIYCLWVNTKTKNGRMACALIFTSFNPHVFLLNYLLLLKNQSEKKTGPLDCIEALLSEKSLFHQSNNLWNGLIKLSDAQSLPLQKPQEKWAGSSFVLSLKTTQKTGEMRKERNLISARIVNDCKYFSRFVCIVFPQYYDVSLINLLSSKNMFHILYE